jgi:hypothetical protein
MKISSEDVNAPAVISKTDRPTSLKPEEDSVTP